MLVINRVVCRSLGRNEVREIGGGGGDAGKVSFRLHRLNKFSEDITYSFSKKLVCLLFFHNLLFIFLALLV